MRDELIDYLRSIKHATEDVKWQKDLVFSVGEKMFAVLPTENYPDKLISFKCTEDIFQRLTQMEGIIPAPYAARFKWVAVSPQSPLTLGVIKELIDQSYDLVYAKLSKKIQKALS